MNMDEIRKEIYDATADGAHVEQCVDKTFVRLEGKEKTEGVYNQALEALHREGALVKVPSAGQSRTTVAYRRSDKPFDVAQIK